jgi:hypothetical protein
MFSHVVVGGTEIVLLPYGSYWFKDYELVWEAQILVQSTWLGRKLHQVQVRPRSFFFVKIKVRQQHCLCIFSVMMALHGQQKVVSLLPMQFMMIQNGVLFKLTS